MKTHQNLQTPFIPLNIAVLTVSDTRDESNDEAGRLLAGFLTEAGHALAAKRIVKDDIYQLRAAVSVWVADPEVNVILATGGTGFTHRDNTPEALMLLFDKQVEGFGELFRHLSYQDIGTSTLQSRAFAGLANRTLIACMPGSPNACRLAWEAILKDQLDQSHRPCNFAEHVCPEKDSSAEPTARIAGCAPRN